METDFFHARQTLFAFILWHDPPEAQSGMGGSIPGLDRGPGRVRYRYLNWLNDYRDVCGTLPR